MSWLFPLFLPLLAFAAGPNDSGNLLYFHPIFTTRVQAVTGANSTNTTTQAVTISSTQVGDLIVVTATGAAGTLSCSDNLSQTYSSAVTIASGGASTTTFYHANTAAGVNTITITSTSSTAINVVVSEYQYVATSSPLDQTHSQSNTGLTWTSGLTAATTQATELLIGGSYDDSHNNSTFSPGTNWVAVGTAANGAGGGGVGYQQEQLVSSTGTYASTGSISSSGTILATIATFNLLNPPANLTYVNQATTLKSSGGVLSHVTINTIGSTGARVSFYDGTVSAATKIAGISLSTEIGTLDYDLVFVTSLIMVVNSTTADFTVSYN